MKIRRVFRKTKSRIVALSFLVVGGSIYLGTKLMDRLFNLDDVNDIEQDDIDKMMGI